MRLRLMPIVLALVLLGATSGALAATGDDWPLLVEGTRPQGWVSYTIATGAGQTAFQIVGGPYTSPITLGFALYNSDDQFVQAVGLSVFSARTGYRIHSTAPPGGPLTVEATLMEYSGPAGNGFTPVVTAAEPTTFKVVMWTAAKALSSWSYVVRGQDATVTGQDSGPGAFIYQSDDFSGVAQAHASVNGVGTRASVMLDKAIDVRDRLFGWYLQPLVSGCCQVPIMLLEPNANLLSVTTPAGERDCLLGCSFFRADEDAGAGRYTFHLSGVGASPLSSAEDVALIGVDARLPA